MATELPIEYMSRVAGADFTTGQYTLVNVNASGKVVAAGLGANALGVITNSPAVNQTAQIMVLGECLVYYGNNVNAGQNLQSDASAHAIPQTGTGAVVAMALESGAAGELHTVLLSCKSSLGSNNLHEISIPVKLANLASGGYILNAYKPGYAGVIKQITYVAGTPATTAAKLATLQPEITGVATTGGAVALTTVGCGTEGALVNGSAITALNTFGATDTISIQASAVTAFDEGDGVILLQLG
jgi:sarcosine oxidase gamma subunit